MTEINLSPKARSLVDRAKGILLKPKAEWAVIAAEPTTLGDLFKGYVCILAAIPAIAIAVGLIVFGWYGYHFGIGSALSVGVGCYISSLVAVAILGFAIELLGPQFGAKPDRISAFKLAAYSMTGFWVAGVLYLLPGLGALAGLAGLYGVYLVYLGLPILAPAEADKAQTWAIVAVIAALICIGIAVGAGQTSGVFGTYADNGPMRTLNGNVSVPGYGSVDLARAEAASKAADAAIASALAEQGARPRGAPAAVTPVSADQLKDLLPGTIAGFVRGEITSESSGAAGIQTASARAGYSLGDSRMTLTVTDMGGAGAFAQLGSAFNVNHSEQTGGTYEKIGNVEGRLTTEKYDSTARSGEYSVVVAERFMVEASGEKVDMTALKAAVASVGFGHLEQLAHAG